LIVLVFARVVANGATKQRTNMKTIAVISQRGRAGKTTVAVHLAVAAEQDGPNTALFDLDPQASGSSWSSKGGKLSPAVVSA
jgi:chromosome partitioning protein